MIHFEEKKLSNGLHLIVHHDATTPMVAVNLTYKVGARDENPERTGFAHLFEHLMFGGSANIPSYDAPLQSVGGENNAFTSNDITNYYVTLPKDALETALWLESDRMLELAFSEKSLEVQRNVVIEELLEEYEEIDLPLEPSAYDTVAGFLINHLGRIPKVNEEVAFEDKKFIISKATPSRIETVKLILIE